MEYLAKTHKFLTYLLVLLMLSCSSEPIQKEELKVLIVGNSILKHGSAPNIGWYGNWGMAATSIDKDFLHIYTKLLVASNKYSLVKIDSQNIAVWENNLAYDLTLFDNITRDDYDILIVRLGENVTNITDYEDALKNMIHLLSSTKTKVIITGVIWQSKVIEDIHRKVSFYNGYRYIPFETFRSDPSNYSWGLFENGGVAAHPSDLGMENIAQLLYKSTIN